MSRKSGYNHSRDRNSRPSVTPAKPNSRLDGELYKRPEPNPFTQDWMDGYDDGLIGASYSSQIRTKPQNYRDGYNAGEIDREELDRTGSSNA